MTFLDVAHGLQDHWKPITKWSLAIIGALLSVGAFLGSMRSDNASMREELREFKQEQRAFNALVVPSLPERMTRLEAEGRGNNRLLVDIKEILELRTDIPVKNSASKRRP